MPVSTPTLLDRFCRYVRIHTEAAEGSTTYPSSPGQWDLGKLLLGELKEFGLKDATLDEFGIVTATLPSTVQHATPVIAWFAHMDTSPETSGKNVKPVLHPNYDGKDIVLPADPNRVIKVSESPELANCVGKTVITTDGTTLLGADNKAGVAVIMETVQHLLKNPSIPHGPVKICFTCDEEIGHGVDHVDVKKLGAVVGYTLDGAAHSEIEGETFSGDKATVVIRGKNIHPSIAKGRMTNAIRLAGLFIERLPRTSLTPETSEGRQGFLHPYRIDGAVAEVTITYLVRDFITAKLTEYADVLRSVAKTITAEYADAKIEVRINEQYRNMADGMQNEPRAMKLAVEATKRAGLNPKVGIIRGGTDGSMLTAKGLPTPNLSTGEHNPHSPLEWTCLEEMESAVKVLVELAQLWGQEKA
ncbi:peptidase T [Zavarzinella formosa]|uniref:peptidase T n=1 Tax=Zavarzinella formosa TaxID=360055 RepID=UPI0002EEDC3F|nr:peptidase T [Zavarzinella formosa]